MQWIVGYIMMHYWYETSLLNNTMLDIEIRYLVFDKCIQRVESIKKDGISIAHIWKLAEVMSVTQEQCMWDILLVRTWIGTNAKILVESWIKC